MIVRVIPFPSVADKKRYEDVSFSYELTHSSGASFSLINYGAAITKLVVPDKDGTLSDIMLGFSDLDHYMADPGCHGSVVGRHANRIRGASFSLNGETYHLPANDGPNNLHGGKPAFQNVFWKGNVLSEADANHLLAQSGIKNNFCVEGEAVLFSYLSEDGECGFPGNLTAKVMYAWTTDCTMLLLYQGTTDKDTLFNPTNHAYFNLGGHNSGSVSDHVLHIDTTIMTNKAMDNIPDGTYRVFLGTAFDFSRPDRLEKTMTDHDPQLTCSRGIDQNYCLNTELSAVSAVADVCEKRSGRKMTVYTNLPGLQIYTGNHLHVSGKEGSMYENYGGVCLETHFFPDSIHHLDFAQAVLRKGETRYFLTGYQF